MTIMRKREARSYARARASHGVVEPLAIAGDPDRRGALFPPLRPLVEQLGLGQHVRFLGYVDSAEMPALPRRSSHRRPNASST